MRTSESGRFHPIESDIIAVVKMACFVKSSRIVSRKTDANPPKPFEMGVVSIKPCPRPLVQYPKPCS